MTVRAELTDGLVSYWPLDVDNGGTTPDVAFTNTMTIVGSPAVSSGQFSNAFTFTGPSTYLTNLHEPDNSLSGLPIYRAGAYTIMMWVKGTNQTAKYLYSEANSYGNNNPLLILQTGQAAANNAKLDVIIRNDTGGILINHLVTTTVVFDDNWHHIAWVDNRGNVQVYVDGNLDGANFNYIPAGVFTMNTTAIGTLVRSNNISTGAIFNGQIDEVSVWERPLSQDEVNQVRTSGIPLPIVPQVPHLYSVPADVVRRQGDWALFSVEAHGSRPYVTTYQWSLNGSPIPGATDRTYQTPPGLQPENSGDYYNVTVANDLGPAAATTNATLTVLADPTPDTTNGLVNYWPLDVFGANTNSPELHFGHYMQMVGMNTNFDIVPGQFGNAAAFYGVPAPGTYGYRVGGSPIYSRTNYTVSLWVNSGVLQSDRRVFSEGRNGAGTNNNSLFTLGTDNTGTTPSATVFVRSDAGVGTAVTGRKSTRAVFDGLWHHLVWTDANGEGRLYIDGVLDESDYTYVRPTVTLDMTMIGVTARGTSTYEPAPVTPFTGNIDEVATWDRVLSWTEIQQVMTNGVPIPGNVVLAPYIAVQPAQKTNNVFVGDDVIFRVQVDGTPPFDFQWRKDSTPISGALNPSAITDTLGLTNVQLLDSNTTYSVVVTNGSGSVTSILARLYVAPVTPITSGEALNLDMGLGGSSNPQPGFSEFTLAGNPASYANGVRVTISGISSPLSDRLRTTVVNNPPVLTQAQIYNDFIFAADTGFVDGNGLAILIERLAPNTPYGLTVWSYDPLSSPERLSTWTETSSGTPVAITNGVAVTNGIYSFIGSTLPTRDFDDTFGGLVTSSATGTLQIEGVRSGGSSYGVFLNAIRLVAQPTGTQIGHAERVNGNLRITVVADYPGQPVFIHQTSDLASGNWTDTGITPVETSGGISIFEIPLGDGNMFFRPVSYPTW